MEKPNLSYIKQISGGDESFEKEFITIIKKELPSEIETYHNNIKNQNLQDAAENVHKLKHKISILGYVKGYEFAITYEENLKKGSLEGASKFDELLNDMTQFINLH